MAENFAKMYKGMRLSVLSRILDSAAAVRPTSHTGITTLRSYSGTKEECNRSQLATEIIPFSKFLEERISQAKRSILVEVNSKKNCDQLFSICEKHGRVANTFYVELAQDREVMLVEMKDDDCSDELFKHISYAGHSCSAQIPSPFVEADFSSIVVTSMNLPTGEKITRNTDVMNGKKQEWNKPHGSEEMFWTLYNHEKMTDLNLRLRFLVVVQMQKVFNSLWKNSDVYPFGGSVNGFGSVNSDLDLSVMFVKKTAKQFLKYKVRDSQAISNLHNKYFNIASILLRDFVPGCRYVFPIAKARVPIIKFLQQYTDIECDLSIHCITGLLATEMFYYVGFLHPLVKPLTYIIKKWAKDINLVMTTPSSTISNFGLLTMVIFFLQQKNSGLKCLLPPLNMYENKEENLFGGKQYQYFTKYLSSVDYKEESLAYATYKFFEYYSRFNFETHGICVRTGKICANKERVPLLIVNPLNVGLNVSKQVGEKELEKMKQCFKIASSLYSRNETFGTKFFNATTFERDGQRNKNKVELRRENSI